MSLLPPATQGHPEAELDIEVRREIFTDQSTIGRLFINGEFECYTLEDCSRPEGTKIDGATCIPPGTYQLTVNFSRRFRRLMPQLLDVPGFDGIRIHAGNTHADTRGCILVGQSRGGDVVGGSRAAYRRLFARLQEAKSAGVTVRITCRPLPSEPKQAAPA